MTVNPGEVAEDLVCSKVSRILDRGIWWAAIGIQAVKILLLSYSSAKRHVVINRSPKHHHSCTRPRENPDEGYLCYIVLNFSITEHHDSEEYSPAIQPASLHYSIFCYLSKDFVRALSSASKYRFFITLPYRDFDFNIVVRLQKTIDYAGLIGAWHRPNPGCRRHVITKNEHRRHHENFVSCEMTPGAQCGATAECAKCCRWGSCFRTAAGLQGFLIFDEASCVEVIGVAAPERLVFVNDPTRHLQDAVLFEQPLIIQNCVFHDLADRDSSGTMAERLLEGRTQQRAVLLQALDIDAVYRAALGVPQSNDRLYLPPYIIKQVWCRVYEE